MTGYLRPVISLIIAAGLQGNLPSTMTIWGAKPDLLLVVLIAYALSSDMTFGAVLGFIAGTIHGSMAGLSMGSFIVTRTITGALAGLVTTRLFSDNPVVSVFSAAWLTAVCEGLFVLTNPRGEFAAAAHQIAGECIYNAGLTLIVFLVMEHVESRRKLRLVNARMRI